MVRQRCVKWQRGECFVLGLSEVVLHVFNAGD